MNKIVERFKQETQIVDKSICAYTFASWLINKKDIYNENEDPKEPWFSNEVYEALDELKISEDDFCDEWNMLCS